MLNCNGKQFGQTGALMKGSGKKFRNAKHENLICQVAGLLRSCETNFCCMKGSKRMKSQKLDVNAYPENSVCDSCAGRIRMILCSSKTTLISRGLQTMWIYIGSLFIFVLFLGNRLRLQTCIRTSTNQHSV